MFKSKFIFKIKNKQNLTTTKTKNFISIYIFLKLNWEKKSKILLKHSWLTYLTCP